MNDDKAVKEVAEKLGFKVVRDCPPEFPVGVEVGGQFYGDLNSRQLESMWNLCVSLTRELQAIREAAGADAARFKWLADNEANLVTHREKLGEGYGIWWNVVKRNKSISGHPLGSPRAAIDYAIKERAALEGK